MNFGLSEAIHEEFRRVFADFPEIEQVLIFGSRAKGGFRDGSDIDLAVFGSSMTDTRFTELGRRWMIYRGSSRWTYSIGTVW